MGRHIILPESSDGLYVKVHHRLNVLPEVQLEIAYNFAEVLVLAIQYWLAHIVTLLPLGALSDCSLPHCFRFAFHDRNLYSHGLTVVHDCFCRERGEALDRLIGRYVFGVYLNNSALGVGEDHLALMVVQVL